MDSLPLHISIIFLATVIATLAFVYYGVNINADKKGYATTSVMTIILAWIFLIALLTFNEFFLDFDSRPPRLFFLIGIPMVGIIALFSFSTTRSFFHKIPLTTLTYVHIVRVPVELVLWWLAAEKVVAYDMTFEGSNYDILSGISAPFAGIFLVGLRSKSKFGAAIWNILALGLVLYIVITAISASPFFYSPEKFNVPNIAVFYFPYVLLPAFIVPVVIGSHLISLYKIFTEPEQSEY